MHFLIWIGLTVAGAILYRMGGSDKYDTKWRDVGTALCCVGVLYLCANTQYNLVPSIFALCATFFAMFASLTSYYKRKGTDATWFNWCLVGLMTGLATFPYAILTGGWEAFVGRIIFSIFAVSVWSSNVDNAIWEECGRGAIITGSCILLV